MKIKLCIFFSLISISAFCQSSQLGNIEIFVNNIINSMPSSLGEDFVEPSSFEFIIWHNIIEDLLVNDAVSANNHADSVGYELLLFTDTTITPNKLYNVLQKNTDSTNYWGTYIFNPSACRADLIIQSPHPKHDSKTGRQGIYCFKNTDAQVFFLSGTHRCNNIAASSCSGTSSVCTASPDNFKTSDMPHNVNNVFHKTTEILYDSIPNSVFIQLHGFGKKASDPYVILSNGTRETPVETDYILSFKNELFNQDNVLTFKIAHIDLAWNRLIGFTNVQGRMINAENVPCANAASSTTGRFIHFEQERIRLRNDETGWAKVSNALSNVFACTGSLPIKLVDFEVSILDESVSLNWSTQSEENNDYFTIEKSIDGESWQILKTIPGAGNSSEAINYNFIDEYPFYGVNYYRLKQTNYDGSYDYSNIKSINYNIKNTIIIYPNPSKGDVFIKSNELIKTINIFNHLGDLIQTIKPHNNTLGKVHLPKGSYYFQVISPTNAYVLHQIIF